MLIRDRLEKPQKGVREIGKEKEDKEEGTP